MSARPSPNTNSHWTMPSGGSTSSAFPETAQAAGVAFASANCTGAEYGVGGKCNSIVWTAGGACTMTGDGLQYGTASCPVRGTITQRTETVDGCLDDARTSIAERSVGTDKFCQALTSQGVFDAGRRECVCATGVFVPEQQRCVGPQESF